MTFEAKIQRTTIVLAIIAVALGAFIAFYEQGTLSSGELAERQGRLLPRFVRTRVTEVVLEREEGRVVLVRERTDEDEVGEWFLSEPVRWPADPDAVDTLLGALEWASSRRTLEGLSDADRASFGFDAPSLRAHFRVADQEVPLSFGGEDALESGLYLTLDDPTVAYVVGRDLLEALDHDAAHFRDRALLSRFGTSTATSLAIEVPDGALRIVKRDESFHLESPFLGQASEPKVRDIMRALGELTATRFVEESPTDLAAYALERPARTVRLEKNNPDGGHSELVLRVGEACGDHAGEVYARIDDGPVVCVEDEALAVLATSATELRESRLVTAADEEVAQLVVTQGGRTFTVTRDEDDYGFELDAGGEPVAVDVDALSEFLRDLRSVRATAFLERTSDPVPRPWLEIRIVDHDDSVLADVKVGPPSAAGFSAVRGDEPVYLTLPPEAEAALTVSTLRFRSRRLIDEVVDDGRRITIGGQSAQVAERTGPTWQLSAPFEAPAERPAVRDIVRELASLEAVRFVSESPEAAHGLPGIPVTVRFETSDDDDEHGDDGHGHDDDGDDGHDEREAVREYTIHLGAAAEDGFFAQLDDDPAVFVVTSAVADALRAPLVSRGVLSTELDVLDGITVEREGLSVTLHKEDDGWHTDDGGLADRDRTRELADRIAVLRAADVVNAGQAARATPRVRVTVTRRASAQPPHRYVINVGSESAEGSEARTTVWRDDLPLLFLVPSDAVEIFSSYTP